MATATRWSPERAWEWHRATPWLCGFNYVPSTAVNSTEFWQAETFDPPTIDRELSLASNTGFNTCRIFLQFIVWQADPAGMKERLEKFLGIAAKYSISSAIILFDDCAFSKKAPFLGKQEDPVPGKMATSWTASPGHARVNDPSCFPELERYVKDIVGAFAHDKRVVMWDLYNEPGNEGQGEKSLPLLQSAFRWAREASPEQPLTSGVWSTQTSPTPLNQCMLEESDILNFHMYAPLDETAALVDALGKHGRPVICSEWMARLTGSRFKTHLPMFKEKKTGCYCWGLVNGRMQAHIPWEVLKAQHPGNTEWFHDLYHADGTPYLTDEIATIQQTVRREPSAGEISRLAADLHARRQEEQALRHQITAYAPDYEKVPRELIQKLMAVDQGNTSCLRATVRDFGWIDAVRFGARAADAAFLIVQHSLDLSLMARALPSIEADARAGRIPGDRYALLYDRYHLNIGKKQRYGSQISFENGESVVKNLEDPSRVDERRRELNMPPLAEYLRSFATADGKPIRILE